MIIVFWLVYLAMGVAILWLLDNTDPEAPEKAFSNRFRYAPQSALFSIILWPVLAISFLIGLSSNDP